MSLEDQFNNLKLQDFDDFIANQQEEHLQLDFKTINKADLGHRDDRKTFAVAISGFANSSGGLIVWGIDARKNANGVDCASGKQEIKPVSRFIARLNEFTGQAVSPVVDGVKHRAILDSGDKGYAVTIVPESDSGPHMAKLGEDRYYKRSGDSFYKMEHFDLEDMFGRRRHPKLALRTKLIGIHRESSPDAQLLILMSIENYGRCTAKAPFLSIELPENCRLSEYGVDGNLNLGLPLIKRHLGHSREVHFGANSEIVIHPGTIRDVHKLSIPVSRAPQDFIFCGRLGAEDMKLTDFEVTVPSNEIKAVINSNKR